MISSQSSVAPSCCWLVEKNSSAAACNAIDYFIILLNNLVFTFSVKNIILYICSFVVERLLYMITSGRKHNNNKTLFPNFRRNLVCVFIQGIYNTEIFFFATVTLTSNKCRQM